MKTIIVNASPRKGGNTAQLLKEAQKGAEAAGAETEYVELFDLSFTGCRSCLACKRKGAQRNKCYWKDDLSPLIEKILEADSVIIGSPIYFGQPTASFRGLMERLQFCALSYDGAPMTYYEGKLNAGFIYTMNAGAGYYEANMRPGYKAAEDLFGMLFDGKVASYASCDTLQVEDYSKYSMGAFSEEAKRAHREEQFPKDLKACFEMGTELSR